MTNYERLQNRINNLNGNMFRFSKESNFMNYDKWVVLRTNEIIISEGNRIERVSMFEKFTTLEIKELLHKLEENKDMNEYYFKACDEFWSRPPLDI